MRAAGCSGVGRVCSPGRDTLKRRCFPEAGVLRWCMGHVRRQASSRGNADETKDNLRYRAADNGDQVLRF